MDNVFSIMAAFIEFIILLYYMSDLSIKKSNSIYKRIVSYVLIVFLIFLTWIFFENIFFKLLFVNIFLSVILLHMYEESIWITELYITTYSLVLLFSEVVMSLSARTLLYELYNITPFYFETICSLLTKFLTFILLFFLKKVLRRIILKKPFMKDMGLMFIQIIMDILFFIFISISINSIESEQIGILYLRCIFFIVIFFVANLYYTEYFVGIHRRDILLEEELKLAQMRSQIYANQIEEEYKIKSMVHDMKNHLLVLKNKALSPSENEYYLSELEEKIQQLNDCIHTGSPYLDILIKEKKKICLDNHIELDLQINLCENTVLNPVEICILFGNLFDNAIEASLQIRDLQKRRIEVIAHNKNRNFVIKLENHIDKPLVWSNSRLVTTKSDKYNHGYGMNNIAKLVNEKKGQYSIHAEDNKFQIYIIFPISLVEE